LDIQCVDFLANAPSIDWSWGNDKVVLNPVAVRRGKFGWYHDDERDLVLVMKDGKTQSFRVKVDINLEVLDKQK